MNLKTWQSQNRCFVRGAPSIFITSQKMPRLPNLARICTVSPFDAALKMRSAKNTQHDMRLKCCLRLPCKMTMEVVQSAAPATKSATHLLKTLQKHCACHTVRLLTRSRTLVCGVTKCHACHTKRGNDTFETSKK